MGIFAWTGYEDLIPTGANSTTVKPTTGGTPTMATTPNTQQPSGMFGWLDSIGQAVGNVLGRAADTVSEGWLAEVDKKHGPESVVDQTYVPPANTLSMGMSVQTQQLVTYGAIAIGGLVTLAVLYKALK